MKTEPTTATLTNSLFFTVLSVLLIGCNASNAQDGTIKRIDNQALIELQKNDNLQLVDVRTPGEFQRGYIEGAQLIDFTKSNFAEKVSELDRNRPIVVYCAVGGRSYQSTSVLKQLGFKEIYDLKGGVQSWASEGLPLKN